MNTTATTFRFSDEERQKLEAIQNDTGLATLQKTVNYMIDRYPADRNLIKHLQERIKEYQQQVIQYERAIRSFQQGFQAINSIEIL